MGERSSPSASVTQAVFARAVRTWANLVDVVDQVDPSQPLLRKCHNDKFPDSSYALIRNTSTRSTSWLETVGQKNGLRQLLRSVSGWFLSRQGVQELAPGRAPDETTAWISRSPTFVSSAPPQGSVLLLEVMADGV